MCVIVTGESTAANVPTTRADSVAQLTGTGGAAPTASTADSNFAIAVQDSIQQRLQQLDNTACEHWSNADVVFWFTHSAEAVRQMSKQLLLTVINKLRELGLTGAQLLHPAVNNVETLTKEVTGNTKVAAVQLSTIIHQLSQRQHSEQRSGTLDEKSQELPTYVSATPLPHVSATVNEHEILGEGATARVYSGRYLNSKVAIKVLKFHGDQKQQQQRVQRFAQELTRLHVIRHANLVICHGRCDLPGRIPDFGMVMEYMPFTLAQVIAAQYAATPVTEVPHLNWTKRWHCMLQVAEGLYALHTSYRMAHGDLKPENILVNEYGVCKITDVGLADIVQPAYTASLMQSIMSPSPAAASDSLYGTVQYMAPERFAPNAKSEFCNDVYSFGCLLLETFSGSRPWPSYIIQQIVLEVGHHRHFPEIPSTVPECLHPIIQACFQPAADRISMRQLLQELRGCKKDMRILDEPDRDYMNRPWYTAPSQAWKPLSATTAHASPSLMSAQLLEFSASEYADTGSFVASICDTLSCHQYVREQLHTLLVEQMKLKWADAAGVSQWCQEHMAVQRVMAVNNPTLQQRFFAHCKVMEQRALLSVNGRPGSSVSAEPEAQPAQHALLKWLTDITLPAVHQHARIGLFAHGCTAAAAERIMQDGQISRAEKDFGFFGAGIYLTSVLPYALRYAIEACKHSVKTVSAAAAAGSTAHAASSCAGDQQCSADDCNREYAVILSWVVMSNVYPITRKLDYTKTFFCDLYGQPFNRGRSDAHFVRVHVANSFQACDDQQLDMCNGDMGHGLYELVVNEQAAVLPQFAVYFKRRPTAPASAAVHPVGGPQVVNTANVIPDEMKRD